MNRSPSFRGDTFTGEQAQANEVAGVDMKHTMLILLPRFFYCLFLVMHVPKTNPFLISCVSVAAAKCWKLKTIASCSCLLLKPSRIPMRNQQLRCNCTCLGHVGLLRIVPTCKMSDPNDKLCTPRRSESALRRRAKVRCGSWLQSDRRMI